MQLTVADVAAVRSVERSRGRLGIAGGEQVDPEPSWAAIDTLRLAGWTLGDICGGLGYRRSSTLPFTRDAVTARNAKQVSNLMAYLDQDLTPPARSAPARRGPRVRGVVGWAADEWAIDLLAQGYSIDHVADHSGLSVAAVTSFAHQAVA